MSKMHTKSRTRRTEQQIPIDPLRGYKNRLRHIAEYKVAFLDDFLCAQECLVLAAIVACFVFYFVKNKEIP